MPDQQKYTYEDKYKIVIFSDPYNEIPYPNEKLPEKVTINIYIYLLQKILSGFYW